MTAAFQANVTVSRDMGLLEAFKQQLNALLSEESDIQNFQEQYISRDLICRFEADARYLIPAFHHYLGGLSRPENQGGMDQSPRWSKRQRGDPERQTY